jgi:hypothetical protein
MITMIVEDVAVVLVIALFVWLVPMRRNGIPGLRGRGRAPVSPTAGSTTPEPRPAPAAEQVGAVSDAGRPVERDDRVVAQLSQFRGASHAGPRPEQDQSHKHSA